MAVSGVGKSTLLGMPVRGTAAPILIVVRGRGGVQDGPHCAGHTRRPARAGKRARAARRCSGLPWRVPARARPLARAPWGPEPPLLRLSAAFTAPRIAEWSRDAGEDVLLVVASITRTALAQREVA